MVALTGSYTLGRHLLDRLQIGGAQLYLQRAEILFEISALLRTGNGDDVSALRQQPGQRELRRRALLAPGDLLHPSNQVEIALEVLALEPRRVAPVIVLRQVFECPETSGQKSSPERAVGHKPDAQLATQGQHLIFGISGPEGILGLQRRNGVLPVGAANSGRS